MIKFEIIKKSKKSQARLGLLKTPHGVVETPAMVPVATSAAIKALTAEQVQQTGSQMLICNTYHLHLRPGARVVKSAGGLHKFMNWTGPIMTDSGGFQVFSLGFGKDDNIRKIIKGSVASKIHIGQQPKLLEITDKGVLFRSFVDGKKVFLGPKESMAIQAQLGADIIFAFDECPPPHADRQYLEYSVARTHAWAKLCLKYKKSSQALFGIVQGGRFKDLRISSARFIGSLPFDGFGIGGELGGSVAAMKKMLSWVVKELPQTKPRHMLGTGHIADIPAIIAAGADTFDSIVPTHYGRHGVAFTAGGKLDMTKSKFLSDSSPLDGSCNCFVCQNYQRKYLTHLIKAKEITGLSLLSFHNLHFFHNLVAGIRHRIRAGKF